MFSPTKLDAGTLRVSVGSFALLVLLGCPPGHPGPSSGFAVNVDVSGLSGQLVLTNNAADPLTVTVNGRSTFAAPLASGAAYAVVVSSQPAGQDCLVTGGTGTARADVAVVVSCTDLPAGYSIGGTVSGLTGTLVLQNNGGDDLSRSANGAYQFATRLNDAATYLVTVKTQPAGQDCQVTNGAGTIGGASITNVDISCADRGYRLTDRGITTEAPSVVKATVHVHRTSDGVAVKDLKVSDFEVLEGDVKVTRSESFLDLAPLGDIPYTLKTVLSLDISASLTIADVESVKTTARNLVRDPDTGKSRLLAGQQVAIYTFDDIVTLRIDFSSNVQALVTAIDGITRGGPSTNLYGAITTGLARWTESYALTGIVNGTLIVVTDGNDTAGVVTKAQAISARGTKTFFAVPVGSEVTLSNLEEIAGAANVLPSSDFGQLQTTLAQVVDRMAHFSDGLYFLYYATPKRSGTHTIKVSIVGNVNAAADATVTGTFSANGFSSVIPVIVKSGPDEVREGTPALWEVRTRWSNDPANYAWAVTNPSAQVNFQRVGLTADGKGEIATFTATGTGFGAVPVVITDQNHSKTLSTSIAAKTSVVPAQLAAITNYRQINLSWRAVTDATGYRLYWKTTGAETMIPVASTSYPHTALTDGVPYTYRVTSIINGSESDSSNAITAIPGIAAPNLSFVTVSPVQVSVSRTASASAVGYRLYWSSTPGVTTGAQWVPFSSSSTSANVTAFVAGQRYYFAMSAIDAQGLESALSLELAPPAIPQISSLTASSAGIEVVWADAPGAETYSLPSPACCGYVTSPFLFTAVTTGTRYTFYLRADNDQGSATGSPVTGARMENPTVLPIIIRNGTATVSWNTVPGADGYRILHGTGPGLTPASSTIVETSANNGTVPGLVAGVPNYFGVVAIAGATESSFRELAPPAIPTIDVVAGTSSVGVTMGAGVGPPGTSQFTVRYVQGTDPDAAGSSTKSVSAPPGSTTVGGLNNGVSYAFLLRWTNSDGVSSSFVKSTVPLAVPSLVANGGPSSVQLNWSSVAGATGYLLYISDDAGVSPTQVTPIVLSTNSYEHTGLQHLSTYSYAVSATHDSGRSTQPTSWQRSVRIEVPPPVLTATTNDRTVQLSWPPVTGAESYVVYWDTVSGGQANVINGATSPLTISSLQYGTTYFFSVASVRDGTAGPVSASVSQTPIQPVALSALMLNPTSLTVDWTGATGATSLSIYHSTTPSPGPTNGTRVVNPTKPFTLGGLSTDAIVYLKVIASNASVTTESNEVAARRLARAERPLIRVGAAGKLTFDWPSVAGANGYNLHYNLAATFTYGTANTQVTGVTQGHIATLPRTADGYFAVAPTWNGIRGQLSDLQRVPTSTNFPDQFEDVALERCVTANGITPANAATTSSLSCSSATYGAVRSLEGIASVLPSLTSLHFATASNSCGLRDLSPLAPLALQDVELQQCGLDDAELATMPPLAGVTSFGLTDNVALTDLAPLAQMTALRNLRLGGTGVTALGPISSLTTLSALHVYSTPLVDLTPIRTLTQLTTLNISSTSVASLTPITTLTQLVVFIATSAKISDVTPLSQLTTLEYVQLNSMDVAIGPSARSLETLTNAVEINFNSTQVLCADMQHLRTVHGAAVVPYTTCQ
ncbi:MAG: fibronectin type III domain-containing protein [Actinomycetota bacterium]|nr:fibronectin type III domain-containing protein [Actinomycetota bacterium]